MKNGILSKKRCMKVFAFLVSALLFTTEFSPAMNVFASEPQAENTEIGTDEEETSVSEIAIEEEETSVSEITIEQEVIEENLYNADAFVLSIDDGLYEEDNDTEIFECSESVDDVEGGWSFDAETLTLTLNGFNGHYIKGSGAFTIVLAGENTLSILDREEMTTSIGIENDNNMLTITDDSNDETINDSLNITYSGEKECIMIAAGTAKMTKPVFLQGGKLSLSGNSTSNIKGFDYCLQVDNNAELDMQLKSDATAVGFRCTVSSKTSGNIQCSVNGNTSSSYVFSGFSKYGTGDMTITTGGKAVVNYSSAKFYLYDGTGKITVNGYMNNLSGNGLHHWYCENYDVYLVPEYGNICDLNDVAIINPVLYYAEKDLSIYDTERLDLPAMSVGDSLSDTIINLEDLTRGGGNNYKYSAVGLPTGLAVGKTNNKFRIYGKPTEAFPAGEAVITVTDDRDNTASVTISVGEVSWKNTVEEVIFDKEEIILDQGMSTTLTVSYNPEKVDSYDAYFETDEEFLAVTPAEYSASDKVRVATINALDKAGVTYVKAIAKAGGATAQIPVYVREKLPQAYVGKSAFLLEGLDANATYRINGTTYTSSSNGTIRILDTWCGQEISLMKLNAEEKCNSGTQLISIPDTLLSEDIAVEMNVPVVGDVPAKAEDIVIYDVKNVDTDITDVYVSVTDVTWSPVVEDAFSQAGTYTVNITLSTIGDMVFPQRVKVDMPSGISFGQTTVSADRQTMQITWMLDVKERTPQIDFYNESYFGDTYKYEFLSGFEKDEIYKINGEVCSVELIPTTDVYGVRTDLDWAGKRIEIIHVSSQGDRYNSAAQKLVIPTNILPKTMDMTLPNYGVGEPVITADDISIKSFWGEEELCGKYIEVYDFSIDKLIAKPDGRGGTYDTADEDFVFGETFEPGRYELFFMLRPVAPLTWTTKSDSDDGNYQRESVRLMTKVYSKGGGFGEADQDYCDYYNIMEIHVKYPMPEGFLTEDGLYIAGLESDGVYAISGNIQTISYLPHVDSYGFKIPIQYAGQQIALVRYCKEDTRLNSEAQYFNVPNDLVTGEFGIIIPPLVAGEPAPMLSEVKFKYLSYADNFLNINFPVQELSYSPEITEGANAEPGTLYKTKIQIKTLNANLKFATSGLTVLINNEEVEFRLLEDGKVLEATFDQYLQEFIPEGYVYENKYIAGLLPDRTYLIDNTEVQTSLIGETGLYGVKIQPDWREKTVSIKLLSDVHEKCNSDEQFLSIAGITMPNEILVLMPTPEYDKPVTGIADVRIYDRSDMTEITNEYIRCSILSWSPDVVDRFAPGVGYTAWLELETCNGLSFNDDTRIWLGDNQVNTEYKAENTRVQFGFTYPRTKIPGIWAKDIEPMQYTGKAIKPVIEVYFGDTLLAEKDYSVTYKNNTNAATADAVNNKGKSVAPTVVIKGKGNYTGTIEKTFTILPIDLDTYESDAQLQQILSIEPVYAKYTGKAIKGTPTVMLNGKKLAVSAKQYTLEYPDESEGAYVNVGTYDILLQGCGKNFIGSTTISETISAKLISKVSVKLDKQSYPYNEENGVTVPNSIIVKDGKEILTAEEDYIVSYMDNDHVGTASLIITGINDYSGTKTVKYKITGKKLSSAMVKMLTTSVTYSAEEISLTEAKDFEVYDGQNLLSEGEHYEISYKGNRTNAGTFSVIFTGINAYSGTVTKKYKIEKMSATEFSVVYDEEVPYTKGATTVEHMVSIPGHILTEGVDYTITYVNNKNIASADAKKAPYFYITGKGNFTGNTKSAPCKFSIVTGDLEAQVSIQVDDVVYKNKNKNYIPKVTLTDTVSGKKLAAKTDYNASLLYEIWDEESGVFIPFESTKVDASEKRVTMRVTVEGANNYSGEVSAEYGICPKNITSVKVEKIATQDYTGKPIEPIPVITVAVKNGKKTEYVPLEPENYRLEYANNINKGTATIYIYGQGDYAGVKKVTFKIGSFKLKWW